MLPAPSRRLVTGHDDNGLAVFSINETMKPEPMANGGFAYSIAWSTDDSPTDNADKRDGSKSPIFSGKSHNVNGGSVIRVVDVEPGMDSPMHRTQSLDYGIVISGKALLILDSGEKQILGPGDICIQRGTNHQWKNASETEPAKIVFVLLDAKPLTFGDKILKEHSFPDQK